MEEDVVLEREAAKAEHEEPVKEAPEVRAPFRDFLGNLSAEETKALANSAEARVAALVADTQQKVPPAPAAIAAPVKNQTEKAPEPVQKEAEALTSETQAVYETATIKLKLGKELGRGGCAVVYEAEDGFGNTYAAKKPIDSETAKLLIEEAKLKTKLRHPHIITIDSIVQGEENIIALMPLMKNHLDTSKKRTVEQSIDIIIQVADALQYAHSKGILHRDIKPENILQENETYMLADFGFAESTEKLVNSIKLSGENTPAVLGTITYMAPEVRKGKPATIKSDIYSIAVVLYELLTNELPDIEASAVLEQKNMPKEIKEIILKGLVREEKRYVSIEELIKDIEKCRQNFQPKKQETSQIVIAPTQATKAASEIVIGTDFDKSIMTRYHDLDTQYLTRKMDELWQYHNRNIFESQNKKFYISYKGDIVKINFNDLPGYEDIVLFSPLRQELFLAHAEKYGLIHKSNSASSFIKRFVGFWKDQMLTEYLQQNALKNPEKYKGIIQSLNTWTDLAKTALTGIFLNEARALNAKKPDKKNHGCFTYKQELDAYVARVHFNGSFIDAKQYATECGLHILDLEHAQSVSLRNGGYVFDNLIITSTDDIAVVLDKPLKLPYHVKNSDILMTETGIPVLVGGEQFHLPHISKGSFWNNFLADYRMHKEYFHKSFRYSEDISFTSPLVLEKTGKEVALVKYGPYFSDTQMRFPMREELHHVYLNQRP